MSSLSKLHVVLFAIAFVVAARLVIAIGSQPGVARGRCRRSSAQTAIVRKCLRL